MKTRKKYLDYLRVISAVAVVLIHVFVTARTDFPEHTLLEDSISMSIAGVLHFCVPVFLMITGALFLNKSKEITIKQLYKKYILKYVAILFVFGWIFAIMEQIMTSGLSFGAVWAGLGNLLCGRTWEHMWYLYMLIGVMVVLPFIKALSGILDSNKELRRYFIVISAIANFIIPSVAASSGYTFPIALPLFSNYVFYLYVGHIIDSGIVKIKKPLLIFVVSSVILVALSVTYSLTGLYVFKQLCGYDSLIILISSVALFGFLRNHEEKLKEAKIISLIGQYSFGTYIVHMFWINIAYKLVKFNIYGDLFFIKWLAVFVGAFVLSLITVAIMKKIPILKKGI